MANYYASRGGLKVGPFGSHQEALDAFRELFPFKGPAYEGKSRKQQILTGYGLDGAYNDMRWHDAADYEVKP